jgi:DNA-binding CsgD family transcriptional regulator/tetratricopeptide (TPR) repeat protein
MAAWVGERTAADLLAALECGARSEAGSGAARRIRLSAVLDTVWAWLDAHERRVLRGLGSFAGDFTREGADRVAGADLAALHTLTRRCLIARIADPDDATRYRMHPLVRRHAARTLNRDPDESAVVRRRHFDYCVSLAEATPGGQGDRHELMPPSVQAEYEAALDWGLTTGAVKPALRLLDALHRHEARWNTPARFQAILEAALARPQDFPTPTSTARAGSLEAAGWAAADCGDHELAGRRYAEAAVAYLSLDDRSRQADSLRGQARAHLARGELGAATFCLRESLAICRRVADRTGAAWSALHLAEVSSARGEPDAATSQLSIAIKDFEQLGVPLGAYSGYLRLGDNQRALGRLPEAIYAYAEALALGRRWQFTSGMGDLLAGVAIVAAELHRPVLAATLLGAARAWVDAFGPSSPAGAHGDRVSAERHVRGQVGEEQFVAAVAAGLGLDAARILAGAEQAVDELASLCRRLPWGITEREVQVLRLVAEGLTNADIAGRLGLSPRTVHAHLRSAYGKLGVSARTAAVRQASSLGLL